MKTEKDKMLNGELYNPMDPQLSAERKNARSLINQLNTSREDEMDERNHILKALIPNAGKRLLLEPPFYCDYGYNITIGEDVFLNFNCIVLDVMQVIIGSRTLIGPNVQIYTAMHPINHIERASGLEYAKPVNIGNDVWIGGSVVICPGVSIGDRSVIGAGSIVTKTIPADSFAAGNPCRVIRSIL